MTGTIAHVSAVGKDEMNSMTGLVASADSVANYGMFLMMIMFVPFETLDWLQKLNMLHQILHALVAPPEAWVYSDSPHIAPTAWFVMAVRGFNPYQL